MTTRTLRLDQVIIPPHLHRIERNEQHIKDLARSIERSGLLNPITVSDNGDDTYTLVAGHNRLLAHEHMGRQTIAATMFTGSDKDAETARFAENLHRENLTPMEEALAIAREHFENFTPLDTIARMLNRSMDWVAQRLQLVDMPADLKELVHTKQLPIGSALALTEITDTAHRTYLQQYAMNAGAAVPVIREWVRQWHLAKDLGTQGNAPRPAMPEAGQPITVMMPCFICGDPHPYQLLRIMRVCQGCTGEIQREHAAQDEVAA